MPPKSPTSRQSGVDQSEEPPCFCSQRWVLTLLGLFAGFCMYTVRVNMSMAIVCMVKLPLDNDTLTTGIGEKQENVSSHFKDGYLIEHAINTHSRLVNHSIQGHAGIASSTVRYTNHDTDTAVDTSMQLETDLPSSGNHDKRSSHCEENRADAVAEYQNAEFSWDRSLQSWILSAYYFGGMLSQVGSGWVSNKYGGKHVIAINMAAQALATVLIPACARLTPYMVIFLRAVIGITGCAVIPAWMDMAGKWSPTFERSRICSVLWLGQIIGTIVTYSTSGLLCAHGFDHGWGSIFYLHGSMLVVFLLPWCYLTASSPNQHPRISRAELLFIESHMKHTEEKVPVPWRQMFTSAPVWSIIITYAGDTWILFTILTCLPLFLKDVLKIDIQRNGLLSSLPFVSMAMSLAIAGHLSDCVRAQGYLTTINTRRLFQTISILGAGLCIVISGHFDCSQRPLVILCICLCTFFIGLGEGGGYVPSTVDFAPRYAGLVMGIGNTLGGISGILAPLIVGVLTKHGTAAEWQRVFYVCGGVAVLTSVAFIVLSRGSVQAWAQSPADEIDVTIETKTEKLLEDTNDSNIELKDETAMCQLLNNKNS